MNAIKWGVFASLIFVFQCATLQPDLVRTEPNKSLAGWSPISEISPQNGDVLSPTNGEDFHSASIWHPASPKPVVVFRGHKDIVLSATFDSTGQRVVTTSKDNTAIVWNSMDGRPVATMTGHTDQVWFASFSTDGQRVVTASKDKTAKVWDATNGRILGTLPGHMEAVRTASFSPGGKYILTVSHDRSMKVWDAQTFREMRSFSEKRFAPNSAFFGPDGNHIVSASSDGKIDVWDLRKEKIVFSLYDSNPSAYEKDHPVIATTALFSPDGKWILAGWSNGTASLWEVATQQRKHVWTGQHLPILRLSFSADGQTALTGATWRFPASQLWDVATGKQKGIVHEIEPTPSWPLFSNDGQKLLILDKDQSVRIYSTSNGKLLSSVAGKAVPYQDVLFTEEGKEVVGIDCTRIASHDTSTGAQMDAIAFQCAGNHDHVSLGPDAQSLLVTHGSHVMEWTDQWKNPKTSRSFLAPQGHLSWATASSNKRSIAANDATTNSIYLWNAMGNTTDSTPLAVLKGFFPSLHHRFFSADGNQLLTANLNERGDTLLTIWNIPDRTKSVTLPVFSGKIDSALLSGDGAYVVVVREKQRVEWWSTKKATLLGSFHEHGEVKPHADIFSDGRQTLLALASPAGVRLIDLANKQLRLTLPNVADSSPAPAFPTPHWTEATPSTPQATALPSMTSMPPKKTKTRPTKSTPKKRKPPIKIRKK